MWVIANQRGAVATDQELLKVPRYIADTERFIEEVFGLAKLCERWTARSLEEGVEWDLELSVHVHLLEHGELRLEAAAWTDVTDAVHELVSCGGRFLLAELVAGVAEDDEVLSTEVVGECVYLDVRGPG